MTYVNPQYEGVVLKKILEDMDEESSATVNESIVIENERLKSIEHYFSPVSREQANPGAKFHALKEKWEADTAHLSSIIEIAMHPAYQQIIGMGSDAILLILAELKKKPGHWFWALKSITGEDPVLPQQRGRIKEMTEAWLLWGRQRGYFV
jgi:hypothetical protein